MITVTIERSGSGGIRRFAVSGHAGFDDPGKDIVCAGVSAVTVGAVNAVEKLTGCIPKAKMKHGWLSAELPSGGNPELDGRVQLLLEGMVVSLQTIADEYGKYLQIKETIKNERV